MITKEMILQRIQTLESDKATLMANYNAVLGALQDCQHWLEQLADQSE